jgi:hypothetical protein
MRCLPSGAIPAAEGRPVADAGACGRELGAGRHGASDVTEAVAGAGGAWCWWLTRRVTCISIWG